MDPKILDSPIFQDARDPCILKWYTTFVIDHKRKAFQSNGWKN